MEKNNTKITSKGNPLTLLGKEVKVNDKAIDFSVVNNSFQEVKLSDFGGKVKILSLFPSIDTGVCSKQAHTFNQEASKLGDNVEILAISNDLPFALGRFCGAEGIDNNDGLGNLKVTGDLRFNSFYEPDTLNGVAVLKSADPAVKLIPYYTWANRGKSPMKIWLPGE